MKKTIIMDKYPVYSLSILKTETKYTSVTDIISYFENLVNNDPVATMIGVFDHYKHTQSLETHEISEDIKDAQNIVFLPLHL